MDLSEVSLSNTNRHPWELSRTTCMFKEISKLGTINTVLDIGCGDGYFDKCLLDDHTEIKELYGVDIFLDNEYECGKAKYIKDIDNLPKNKKYDLILMMDVFEHIEDDKSYAKKIFDLLSDEGTLLVTVPAFMKLYSLHDKELKHFRRYDMKMLDNMLTDTGLYIVSKSYFYFSLIILRLLTMNKTENLSMWDSPRNSFKTKFVEFVLNADYTVLRLLSRIKIYIPGLSLLAIIKKDRL